MNAEQAASVAREVASHMNHARDEILDGLIARLLTPAELGWRDARTHAPPEGEQVLVAHEGEVFFAKYLGENGQPYRRLPNKEAWGHWGHRHHDTAYYSEGPNQFRWWMPVPLAPKEGP